MPHDPVQPELWVADLGRVPYADAITFQERVREARQDGRVPDCLLLLEHPPVYTRGRRTGPGDLPMGEDWYRTQGIEICDADRGGGVTYHGPGQLVGYPIIEVHDVPGYVHSLEHALIAALAEHGIDAAAREGQPGVWAGDAKLGSIGVHVSRGVTTHGFAVNVDGDLQPFEWVTPCGIENARVTSILKETGETGQMGCFRKRAAHHVAQALGRRQRLVSSQRLSAAALPEAAAEPALLAERA